MVKFLIHRPIAGSMSLLAILVLGLVSLSQIPFSLMPDTDIKMKVFLKAFNYKIMPILLTIISTVIGLLPFIWGGQKEVFWFAFAAGSIGGLIFSMVAILIYLPLFLRLGIKP